MSEARATVLQPTAPTMRMSRTDYQYTDGFVGVFQYARNLPMIFNFVLKCSREGEMDISIGYLLTKRLDYCTPKLYNGEVEICFTCKETYLFDFNLATRSMVSLSVGRDGGPAPHFSVSKCRHCNEALSDGRGGTISNTVHRHWEEQKKIYIPDEELEATPAQDKLDYVVC